ncbi:hypothetical protein X805_14690 [Sphaerotilus natans subsp. natans DSM 6575]|uniref:Uncharacterized protein n=1 Tax=Sphaerotilus natans subsp. natans DSM 6575 TaxID=1286631 RepID=A0A059KN89_9BURK|nr:hypothetical protein X805_14690 [Sphaerotilus natans subsp. natans DSM 6575]
MNPTAQVFDEDQVDAVILMVFRFETAHTAPAWPAQTAGD